MSKVLMRATDKMPERQARRMQYRTRMMTADIQGGSEFEVSSSDARILRKQGYAENAVMEAPRRGPGRPRKTEADRPQEQPPQQAEAKSDDPYAEKSVADLRTLAEERGVALPHGYVKRSDLLDYLEGRKTYEAPEEDDGA